MKHDESIFEVDGLTISNFGSKGGVCVQLRGDWLGIGRDPVERLVKALQHHLDSTPVCGDLDPFDGLERCRLEPGHRERHESKTRVWPRAWDQGDEIDAMATAHRSKP